LLRIAQNESEIIIDQTMAQGVERLMFRLDGRVSVNYRGPIQMRSKASWDGTALVLSSVNSLEERNVGTSRESYMLDGDTLTFEQMLNRPDGTVRARRLVYSKER
jgi:hypothetical protein